MPSHHSSRTDEGNNSSTSVGAGQSHVPFDHLQSACELFSKEWETGVRPNLPSYLKKVADDNQATLLRNLLEYEVLKRRERGESPRAEDYLEQLPNQTAVIRQVFLETSSLNFAGDCLPDTVELPKNRLPASRLGDFRLVRQIGRGGMGTVYEAVHATRGHRVALKTLPSVNPDALHRFKREFRLVAEMTHPNLVGLHTLENDGDQYFITMDLIDGVDFRSWVRPGSKLDEQRLRSALPQLVAAVMGLHAQGVVHRDLKPQNVLVTSEGRLVVLDFGLVAELAGATGSLMDIAGTPAFMAPEQAVGNSVGPPADWYAIGVMLYDALVGRLPFQVTDFVELFRQKQERDAPPLPADAPAELADLCMRLLARLPADRPDPSSIAGTVQAHVIAGVQRGASPDELIGREAHLATLAEANRAATQHDEPVTVFISGRSGEGKTTLADRFLATLPKGQTVILTGRCYDRESVPFKALDTLIEALTDHLRSMPSDRAAQLLPDDIGILAQLFPELNRCDVLATAPTARIDALDQHQVRARAFGALRLLLDRVAQRSPVVAFIDDLQWGDEDSARALFEVLRPPNAPRVLFLGSYRSDEEEDSPFLNEWRALRRVNDVRFDERIVGVGPLSLEQSTTLVIGQLGVDNANVRKRAVQFHAQTGGNPFLLVELAGCFDPESDAFYATDIHGVLDQKLSSLPREARPLLEVVSISGQSLDPEEAMATLGLQATDTLIAMRNSRLLRLVGKKVDTYHDRIRYAILDKLNPSVRQERHSRLAAVIEQRAGGMTDAEIEALTNGGQSIEGRPIPRVYDLAYHWDAANDQRRALAYSMAAANQARGQFALDVAAEQFAVADRNAEDAPKQVRFAISRGRAEALLLLGDFEQAGAELDRALSLAELAYDEAELIGLKGILARKLGMVQESIAHLENAIGRLGVRMPRTTFGLWWSIGREASIQSLHTIMPSRLHRHAPDRAADLCTSLLGHIEWSYYTSNVPRLLWASFVGLNRAERVPRSSSLSLQYVVHANDMAVLGLHRRAEKYYDAARDLSSQLNDHWGVALAMTHRAIGSVAAARYERGLDAARKGMDLFSKIGDVAEVHMAHFFVAMNLCRIGDFPAAAREAHALLRSCIRHDDNLFATYALSLLSESCLGSAPFDQLVGSVQLLAGNRMGQTMLLMGEGYWHTQHERTVEALSMFEQAWEICRKNYYLTTFNMSVASQLASALRRHAEALERQDSDSSIVRRRWCKVAKLANRLSWFLPPERPHALRELSLAYAHRGRFDKALKLVNKSCLIAKQQHARYQHAQSLLAQGNFLERINDPEAGDMILAAQQEIEEIEGALREVMQ